MKWYTAIGCKMEDDEGRLLVKIDGQEKARFSLPPFAK